MNRLPTKVILLLLAGALAAPSAFGQLLAVGRPIRNLDAIDIYELPKVDAADIRLADEQRAELGEVPHYAKVFAVEIDSLADDGEWELRGKMAYWRLRLISPGALSLSLAFGRYEMPPGGRLFLASADGRYRIGPFTASDNEAHGQLWTPPITTDDLILELRLPLSEIDDLVLVLNRVHHGYAGFGASAPKSGDCHLTSACAEEAGPWSDQARAVGLVAIEGIRFCTGFLVNNTALDGRPLFVTAAHCGITPDNAPSVVVVWNHESASCHGDGAGRDSGLDQFQTGAIFRASYRRSDIVLLELDDPPDPELDVYFAGWDRRPGDPEGVTVIHHPNTDTKRISFDSDRAVTTGHLSGTANPSADHLRVGDWDLGSTEGGSSGAPLFNRDRRVVGQLHGGYAACGVRRADWFGRFSAAWSGGGGPDRRLSDWLDPLATDAATLDGLDGSAALTATPPDYRSSSK